MTSPVEYSVIKSGVISLKKYLAKLYKKNKIIVNCVTRPKLSLTSNIISSLKDGQILVVPEVC